MDKIDKLLKQANERLKNSNTGIVIYRRGQKLSLRGMLPPKPGKNKFSQQIISLGVYCNPAGIQNAEKQAQKLASELALKEFSWNNWINIDNNSLESVAYWCDRFKEDYFKRRKKTIQTEQTWKVEYKAMFDRLPKEAELSAEIILNLVFTTEPDTRQRKRAVMVGQAFAKFAGLDLDLSAYRGNYNSRQSYKDIPSDSQIAKWYQEIPNQEWRYVFAIMAAYGISNHELFYVDLNSLQNAPGHLISNYRKDHYGTRKIWCLYPEWWEEWELYKPQSLPKLSGQNNRDLGSRITQAFKRYGLCRPNWLRHAWAIRAMNFMPNPMAARMMAHTEIEHFKTYQRWINESHEQKMYEILMSRSDRPKPPVLPD